MCPACIATTAALITGAGSAGGLLAACLAKLKKFIRANRLGQLQKA